MLKACRPWRAQINTIIIIHGQQHQHQPSLP